MSATSSTMLALGGVAVPFELPNVASDHSVVSLSDFSAKPVLIMFICNHCPFVLHLLPCMAELANTAQSNGIGVIAISSNDALAYPQDGPQAMHEFAKQHGFEFPYLYDESQSTAKAYQAACTPDFYLFDGDHRLCYRGQMDGARPGNSVTVNGADLQAAIDALLSGSQIAQQQLPSIGCSIKWKPGQTPNYS